MKETVFPGDAAEAAEVSGASKAARQEVKGHDWRVLAVLSMLMAFASISTDLYLPAMPAMEREFSTSAGMIEWTVSGYLIGFSLGQLFWGPVSDRYGRRLPIAVGISLFILGSAGCAMSGDVWSMITWRVVQALGACASVVLARAMVRDLYHGHQAAQMMSTLITVMAIAPLVGPFVGGQILLFSGWRMVFWLLVVVGIVVMLALFTLPETLSPALRSREPLIASFKKYLELISHRSILVYAMASGFFYGGVYAYIAGSPFSFISYHHLPAQYYGFLFGLSIIGIMVSNMINSKILPRFGGRKIMIWGVYGTALSGLVLAFVGATDFGGLIGLMIPLFFFVSMNGFIVANSMAGALENFPKHAGSVSALVGAFQYGCGIIGSAFVGLLADGTAWPMCLVMAATGIGSFLFSQIMLKSGNTK